MPQAWIKSLIRPRLSRTVSAEASSSGTTWLSSAIRMTFTPSAPSNRCSSEARATVSG